MSLRGGWVCRGHICPHFVLEGEWGRQVSVQVPPLRAQRPSWASHSPAASILSLFGASDYKSLSRAVCLSVCDILFSCLSMCLSLCDTHKHTQMHNTHAHSIYPHCTQTTHMYLPFFTHRHCVHTNPCTMRVHTQHACVAHTHSTQTHIPPIDVHTIHIYSTPISHIHSLTNTTYTPYRHTYNSHTPPKHTFHPHTSSAQKTHAHRLTPPLQTHRHICCTCVHTRAHAHTLAAQLPGLHTCSGLLYHQFAG